MPVPATRRLEELAAVFTAQRPRLRSIAYRLLGSPWNADDAVQETWLRFERADAASIRNPQAWLTTVISRVCIDHLRQQAARHEDLDAELPDDATVTPSGPEDMAASAEDVGAAMHVILDVLEPLERLAFVLHDVFGVSFDEIAPILERTSANARQLASRARRRLRTVDLTAERERQREAVGAFLAAAREGDFGRLLQVLDPDVELRTDDAAVSLSAEGAEFGAPLLAARSHGADAVARVFAGRADLAEPALVEARAAAIYAPAGTLKAVYLFHIMDGRITRIDAIGEPGLLADLTINKDEPLAARSST